MKVQNYFKYVLLLTFFLNLVGAVLFAPPSFPLRQWVGLPEAGNPFYGWLITIWIIIFGLAYFYFAFSKTPERLFIGVAAAGKASFALLLILLSLTGDLERRTALLGLCDLLLAGVFVFWLYSTKR